MKLTLHYKCRRCGHIKVAVFDDPFIKCFDHSRAHSQDFINRKELHDCIDGTGINGVADLIGLKPYDPSTHPA